MGRAPFRGPVFVTDDAIFLVATSRSFEGVWLKSLDQSEVLPIEGRTSVFSQKTFFTGALNDVPASCRRHRSMRKLGRQARVAVIDKAMVTDVTTSIWFGVRLNATDVTIIMMMMPWRIPFARSTLTRFGYGQP